MINLSDDIRQAFDVSTKQYDKIKVGNMEIPITNVRYDDDCYFNGTIFGTAISRLLYFEIENNIDLEEKEFEYLTGIRVDNTVYYISLGSFITIDVEPGDTTNINKVTAMDYMFKANVEYRTNLDYSSNKIRLIDVAEECCKNIGIELATKKFPNYKFIVDSNQFEEGTLVKQVFQAIAGISGSFAKVRPDNKLYLINPKLIDSKKYKVKEIDKMKVISLKKMKIRNITNDLKVLGIKKESTKQVNEMLVKSMDKISVKKLTTNVNEPSLINKSDYSDLILKRNTHPINLVSIGMDDIEGENIVRRDSTSIEIEGENALEINDNPFAYNQGKREELIDELYEAVKGFSYTAYQIDGQFKPYMETGDPVWIIDKKGSITSSFLFRFSFKSPNGLESEMAAPSIIKASVNYQNIPDELDRLKKTEIVVNKHEGIISGIIEEQTADANKIHTLELNSKETMDTIKEITEDYKEQIAQLKLDINGLKTTVSSKGGGNLLFYSKENWEKPIKEYQDTNLMQNSISNLGYELIIGRTMQVIQTKNGMYSISFLYKNNNELANARFIVNDEAYRLNYTSDKWTEFYKKIDVKSNIIKVELETDTNNCIYIADLMCNLGDKQTWQQNANETITETVQIGKGIQVNSNVKNTYTRIDADGNRTFNRATNERVAEMTDKGGYFKELEVVGKAQISGMLIQQVSRQVWLSSLL